LSIDDFRLKQSSIINRQSSIQEQSSIVNLQFSISDTGPGIAPDELDHLFEAFEQTTTGQKTQEGTGLGLSISQKFVQLMGGRISVTSEVGKGSTFTVEIPVSVGNRADMNTKLAVRRIIALAPNQPQYRLLVVDDNWDSRRLLRCLLAPLGFELREAANGQEAFEVWKHWKPHLIFMDMRMPGMDGYTATREIRNSKSEIRNVLIIALTADTWEKDRAAALSTGCDDFLGKPFSEANVFDLLHKHLGIQYVYEKETQVTSRRLQVADTEELMPAALAALPPELLEELHIAVSRSRVNLIDQAIQEIHNHDAALADALARLANNFRYTEMLTLIQEARELTIDD
jgi:CheY-like chemotaxis protein